MADGALPAGYGPPVISRFFGPWCRRLVAEREDKRLAGEGLSEHSFERGLMRMEMAIADADEKAVAREIRREMGWED